MEEGGDGATAAAKGADGPTTGEETILSGGNDATEGYEYVRVICSKNTFISMFRNGNGERLQESAEEELVDRLSDLPDCLIVHILSFLCTRDAVRTCVLSKRMTGFWTQVHVLDIRGERTIEQQFSRPSLFIQFMDKALSRSESAAQVLLLDMSSIVVSEQLLKSWIDTILFKQLREIHMHTEPLLKLRATSFYSTKLVVLKLTGFEIDVQEGFCPPKLESLGLYYVSLHSENSLKNLLSGCSMLREAFIHQCRITGNMHLHSSSLKRLEMLDDSGVCDKIDVISIDAPNLEHIYLSYKALNYDITLPAIVEAKLHLHGWTNEVAVFHSFSSAKILRLCPEMIPEPSTVRDPPTAPFPLLSVFHNLLCLEIDICYSWSFILFMLGHCPILETVIVNNVFYYGEPASAPDDMGHSPHKNDPDHPLPRCLSSQLRHVEIYNFVLTEKFLEVVDYFLQNTVYLRKMYISMRRASEDWEAEDPDDVRGRLMKLCPDLDRFSVVNVCLPKAPWYLWSDSELDEMEMVHFVRFRKLC